MSQNAKRIERVIAHIHDNPAGDLSLDALAEVAALSRFHFHRLYRAMTGETCVQAVKRLRMYRAAVLLVQSDRPAAEIGGSVAYSDPASFSRAFSSVFGISPTAFRAAGRMPLDTTTISKGEKFMHNVEIRDLPARRLAALEHRGAYPDIARAFQTLYAKIGGAGLFGHIGAGVAVYHCDPSSMPEAELRSHAGVELKGEVSPPDGAELYDLPGGRAAVLTYKGPYTGLPAVYDYLYGTWLAGSDEEPSAHPSYEVYLNDPTQVGPDDLLTEVCVPLRD